MALIKCSECGKEISDKAKNCVHCGCPVEKELTCNECGKNINIDDNVCKNCGCPIEKKKNKKKTPNLFMKIWLIFCIIVCLLISGINLFNILNLETSSINVMGILTLILAINYGILLKTLNKKWFYLLLGINGIILMYNLLYFQMITHLFYIICVILNVLITFFVVRKKLKSSKFSIKSYLPIFITIIVAILLTFLLDYSSNIRSNERNANIPQIEIITDYINIRYDKDVNSNVIGEVYFGEIYDIISEDEESSYNWYEIETSNGIRGFIAGKSKDVEYVKELEVNGVITNEEETRKEEETEEKKEEITAKPNINSNNNNSNNNSNSSSNNNNYAPIPESIPISYNITSISGIGNTYKYKDYNECRVDNLTATVKEIALEDKLQVDYTITMTKTQKFYDKYDSFCYVKLSVYDGSNLVVGSYSAFVDVELNETGRQTHWIYIDKSGTNYSIKIKEDN